MICKQAAPVNTFRILIGYKVGKVDAGEVSDKICTNLCKLPEQRSKIHSSVCILDVFFHTNLKENMIAKNGVSTSSVWPVKWD